MKNSKPRRDARERQSVSSQCVRVRVIERHKRARLSREEKENRIKFWISGDYRAAMLVCRVPCINVFRYENHVECHSQNRKENMLDCCVFVDRFAMLQWLIEIICTSHATQTSDGRLCLFFRCGCNFSIVLHNRYTTTCFSCAVRIDLCFDLFFSQHLLVRFCSSLVCASLIGEKFSESIEKRKIFTFNSCYNFHYSVSDIQQHVHTQQTIELTFCLRLLAAVRRCLKKCFAFVLSSLLVLYFSSHWSSSSIVNLSMKIQNDNGSITVSAIANFVQTVLVHPNNATRIWTT